MGKLYRAYPISTERLSLLVSESFADGNRHWKRGWAMKIKTASVTLMILALACAGVVTAQANRGPGLPEAPTLHADHPIGMVDVPVRITVSDLTPGQLFRISGDVSYVERPGAHFVRRFSCGHCRWHRSQHGENRSKEPTQNQIRWACFGRCPRKPVPVEIWNILKFPPYYAPDLWDRALGSRSRKREASRSPH